MNTYSDAFRRRRKALGLRLRDVASRTGIAESRLSGIETGRVSNAEMATLSAIADALDLEFVLVPRGLAPHVQALAAGESAAMTVVQDAPSALDYALQK